MASNSILEMKNITKTFPGVKALDDVTLKVTRGEIHAICGENGLLVTHGYQNVTTMFFIL